VAWVAWEEPAVLVVTEAEEALVEEVDVIDRQHEAQVT